MEPKAQNTPYLKHEKCTVFPSAAVAASVLDMCLLYSPASFMTPQRNCVPCPEVTMLSCSMLSRTALLPVFMSDLITQKSRLIKNSDQSFFQRSIMISLIFLRVNIFYKKNLRPQYIVVLCTLHKKREQQKSPSLLIYRGYAKISRLRGLLTFPHIVPLSRQKLQAAQQSVHEDFRTARSPCR